MSNRGLIMRLLFGILLLASALWGLRIRSTAMATSSQRPTLADLNPLAVTRIEVTTAAYTAVVSRASSAADWRMSISGGPAMMADAAVVMRLLDALAQSSVGDALTFGDLREMKLALADFGLAPPEISIKYASDEKGRGGSVSLGLKSPSGTEVYAIANDSMGVLAVPVSVAAAVPETVDGFRPRRLLAYETSRVTAVDVHVPDVPFVKLLRTAAAWRLKSTDAAPALPSAVERLLEAVSSAEILGYVATGAPIQASALAPYGIDPGKGPSVTVYGPGEPVQIVFGAAVDDAVYALVQNGGAVVKVAASLKSDCSKTLDDFRDTRLFPVAPAQVDSVTVSSTDGVCILRREGDDWMLESPVAAATDGECVAEFLQRLFAAESSATSSVPAEASVTVKVGGFSAVLPKSFADASVLAALHTRTVLALDPALLARVTVKGEGADAVKTWSAAAGEPIPGAVTEALAGLKALTVECLSASPEELARYGLDKPYRTVAVDLKATDSIRRNLIVGAECADKARYATLSGSSVVFTLSAAALAAFGI